MLCVDIAITAGLYAVKLSIILLIIFTAGKGSKDYYDDTWVFDFNSEEWTQMNFTGGANIPEARYFAAGGGVYSDDDGGVDNIVLDEEEEESEGEVMVWMSMGVNKVQRKLSDTWTLNINLSKPFQGL